MKHALTVALLCLTTAFTLLPAADCRAAEPLPAWAQKYFDGIAEANAAAVAACFSADAVVIDVSRRITGRSAIEEWTRREVLGGRYTLEDWAETAGGIRMLVRFSPPPGSSPGWKAFYTFTQSGGSIGLADLQYAPADAAGAVAAPPSLRASLTRTVHSFVTAINRGSIRDTAALFAPEARFDSVGRIYRGRAEIMDRFLTPEVIEVRGVYELLRLWFDESDARTLTAEFRFRTPSYNEHFTYRLTVENQQIVDAVGRYIR